MVLLHWQFIELSALFIDKVINVVEDGVSVPFLPIPVWDNSELVRNGESVLQFQHVYAVYFGDVINFKKRLVHLMKFIVELTDILSGEKS